MFSGRLPFRKPFRRSAALAVVTVVALTGCTGQVVVRDYGKDAKANFVGSCMENLRIEDNKRVTETLAPRSYCTCVYEAIDEKTATLYYMAPDMKQRLFALNFFNLGVFKIAPEKVEAGAESVRRIKVSMYCEDIKFEYTNPEALYGTR